MIRSMIKDSEIVTKEYLKKELTILRSDLRSEMKDQKNEIIREVRTIIFSTMEGAMENMKISYEEESKRHMSALLEGFRDEMRVYKDGLKMWMERIENHEHRITGLEHTRV